MKKISINLYSFAELSEQAKQRAIQEHLEFLDNMPEQYEDETGELVTEYLEHSIHEAIESIEMNEYIFYFNGEMVNSTTYVGGHPLAGITEVIIHGEKFSFND